MLKRIIRSLHDQITLVRFVSFLNLVIHVDLIFVQTSVYKSSTRLTSYTAGNKKKSPVWAWTEWDPLEEIVLGIPDMACCPELLPEAKV